MDEMSELVVLVDENDAEIGKATKLDAHRNGALHRAISVIIWDDTGRLLLQKRAVGKYHSGGLWTNACCGHPRPGERAQDAALRRLHEEMGFTSALESLGTISYRAELDRGMIEHELVHMFRGVHGGTIAPNPAEADGFQWANIEDVRADIAATPLRFSAWLREYIAAQWPMALAAPGR